VELHACYRPRLPSTGGAAIDSIGPIGEDFIASPPWRPDGVVLRRPTALGGIHAARPQFDAHFKEHQT
jgi:hypothetical protein